MDKVELQLTLNATEAALLDDLLAARVKEMRFELARTDDRHYRAEVRERLDRLETIAAQVSALVSPQSS